MIKRFFKDLLYGYPAFSNLRWSIIDAYRKRTGYYKMDPLSLKRAMKWSDIMTHQRRIVTKKDCNKLFKAIHNYNEIIDKLNNA